MENFKGTKGKWSVSDKVKENDRGAYYVDINCIKNGSGVIGLASVYEGTTEHFLEEMNANAKIISKAPELLEMIQYIVDNSQGMVREDIISDAKDLIKESTEL